MHPHGMTTHPDGSARAGGQTKSNWPQHPDGSARAGGQTKSNWPQLTAYLTVLVQVAPVTEDTKVEGRNLFKIPDATGGASGGFNLLFVCSMNGQKKER